MELKHIAIEHLSVSRANMRGGRKGADITGILPSVRARGVLVPLIVRANGSPDTYEIVAGRRRFEAACAVASEACEIDPLPCAVIEAGDDAAALEASLIENIARLEPDEVTQWETFTRLIREGRSAGDIALTFGLTDVQVKRTLALGNLLPRIRSLYRRGEIDAATVRHLTLATKAQQRDWLALIEQGLAWEEGGAVHFKPGLIETLRQRGLRQVAGQLSKELGLDYAEHRDGTIEGIYRKPIQVGSSKFALIEKSREFTLVPWRPVLEKQVGRYVSGIQRGGTINWTFGRQRTGPEIGGF